MLTEGTWEWAEYHMKRGHTMKRAKWTSYCMAMNTVEKPLVVRRRCGFKEPQRTPGIFLTEDKLATDWEFGYENDTFNIGDL